MDEPVQSRGLRAWGLAVNSAMHVTTSESRGELHEERERQTKRDKEIKFETVRSVRQLEEEPECVSKYIFFTLFYIYEPIFSPYAK